VPADNGRRIAAVIRQVGGPGRIESFGSGDGPRLLDRYRQAWRKEGSPAASDLGLTANFGSTGSGRAWRRLALGASVVAISWHEMPQSLTQTPSMHTRSRACAQGWRFGVAS